MEEVTKSERRLIRLFGPLGWIYVAFWYPYALTISHRHRLSHWPILGTASRIGYVLLLLGMALGGLYILGVDVAPFVQVLRQVPLPIYTAIVSGLVLSDVGHFVFDVL